MKKPIKLVGRLLRERGEDKHTSVFVKRWISAREQFESEKRRITSLSQSALPENRGYIIKEEIHTITDPRTKKKRKIPVRWYWHPLNDYYKKIFAKHVWVVEPKTKNDPWQVYGSRRDKPMDKLTYFSKKEMKAYLKKRKLKVVSKKRWEKKELHHVKS